MREGLYDPSEEIVRKYHAVSRNKWTFPQSRGLYRNPDEISAWACAIRSIYDLEQEQSMRWQQMLNNYIVGKERYCKLSSCSADEEIEDEIQCQAIQNDPVSVTNEASQKRHLGMKINISTTVLIHCSAAVQDPKYKFRNKRSRKLAEN